LASAGLTHAWIPAQDIQKVNERKNLWWKLWNAVENWVKTVHLSLGKLRVRMGSQSGLASDSGHST